LRRNAHGLNGHPAKEFELSQSGVRAANEKTAQENAAREQIIISARTRALNDALELAKIGDDPSVEKLIANAKAVEGYILNSIDTIKPKSGLVVTGQMPPPGAGFKPGD
jgi:hypothetical protein